jgi:tetratricopeptide (TPR) repeat protein
MELLERGNTLLIQEDFESAVSTFDQAIAADANLAEAHLHKAVALISLGDYEAAVAAANSALSLDEKGYAFFVRGKASFYLEKWEDAERDFTAANERETSMATDWLRKVAANKTT